MKLLKAALFTVVALGITACGPTTIEPGTVGKVLTPSGYNKEILPPQKTWLGFRESVVRVDTTTHVTKESVVAVLKDKMELTMDVRFTGRLDVTPAVLNPVFNDVIITGKTLTYDQVYQRYVQPKLRQIVREVLIDYDVESIQPNYSVIAAEIKMRVSKELVNTPVQISDFNLGRYKYPIAVTKAIEDAKKRQMDLEKTKADNAIALQEKENELAIAQANKEIALVEAQTTSEANKILGQSITEELLELKRIEVQRILANNSKDNTKVYVPLSMGVPSLVEKN